MSAFNLPPGCQLSDIPGNGRDEGPRCEECGCFLSVGEVIRQRTMCFECREALEEQFTGSAVEMPPGGSRPLSRSLLRAVEADAGLRRSGANPDSPTNQSHESTGTKVA